MKKKGKNHIGSSTRASRLMSVVDLLSKPSRALCALH